MSGLCLKEKTALLMALREANLILVGFDRASLPMHAGVLTREGLGHAGVILFRRSAPSVAFGQQPRLLTQFWRAAAGGEWADRIEYLPRPWPARGPLCRRPPTQNSLAIRPQAPIFSPA